MIATMLDLPLSLNPLLERAGKLFPGNHIVSQLPHKAQDRFRIVDDILLQPRELFPR